MKTYIMKDSAIYSSAKTFGKRLRDTNHKSCDGEKNSITLSIYSRIYEG